MERALIRLSFALMLAAAPAAALWPDDPAENLSIADRPGEQTIPKIAARADGGCYVAWFDQASGNYDVYLQRLDAAGEEAWPHNGILVSGHPQDSWLTDWDLIADADGNAVLVFNDLRDGGDWDIFAYRIAADGAFLWGPDGAQLSDNDDFEVAPRVVEADDGELVFVWARLPDAGDGSIMMQRLAPDGTAQLAPGGLAVAGEPGESPANCTLCPAGEGSVIVGWVRDISLYMSPRHYRAERFGPDGASLWGGPVEVYDETSLPIAYQPEIAADGAGGAWLLWHRYLGGLYNSCVQRLDAGGAELFGHNGVTVSTLAGMYHISPTMALDGGDLYVFWDERNTSQSQWGIFGQRFSGDGERLWGDSGREFLPTDTLYKFFHRALPVPGGALLFWMDEPAGYGSDRVRGFRVDSSGEFGWEGDIVDVATTPSVKGRLPVTQSPGGTALLAWTDDRAGSLDVYGQNVHADGSLGGDPSAVDEAPAAARLLGAWPNPFNPTTTLAFSLDRSAQVELSVHDVAGRRLRTLCSGWREAGRHELIWDGRDGGGRTLSSGVYLARLRAGGAEGALTLQLLK